MATYNIEIREFNGSSYDVLYPKTTINNVDGLSAKISQLDTMSSDIEIMKNNISALDANKQNKLTFDSVPTANSNNPVQSKGILSALNNKLSLSGGTLTGNLNIQRLGEAVYNARNDNLTLGTTPTSDTRVGGVFLRDKNDQSVAYLDSFITANGRSRLSIVAVNKVNNTNIYNTLDIGVAADGGRFVAVSDASAWRSAIGAVSSTQLDTKVSKSGGTMTGALNLANNILNNVGDDCAFGDSNVSGCISLKGLNNPTGLNFIQYNGTSAGKLTWDGTSFNLDKPLKLNGGTLQPAYGGTGLTASPSMLTNLGSTSASNVFQASPRPGITGTLGIPHGGTGASTAASALQNLGVTISNVEISEGSTLASGSIYIYYE